MSRCVPASYGAGRASHQTVCILQHIFCQDIRLRLAVRRVAPTSERPFVQMQTCLPGDSSSSGMPSKCARYFVEARSSAFSAPNFSRQDRMNLSSRSTLGLNTMEPACGRIPWHVFSILRIQVALPDQRQTTSKWSFSVVELSYDIIQDFQHDIIWGDPRAPRGRYWPYPTGKQEGCRKIALPSIQRRFAG